MLMDFEEKVNDMSLYGAFVESAFNEAVVAMIDSNTIVVSYDIYDYFDDVVYPVFKKYARGFMSEEKAREELENTLNNKLRDVFDDANYNPKAGGKTILFVINNRSNFGMAYDFDEFIDLTMKIMDKISKYKKVTTVLEGLKKS